MHTEFHSVNPKKEKAADCIYLTEDRNCQCKDCPQFLGLCYHASICKFRKRKSEYHEPVKPSAPPKPRPICPCTLFLGTRMESKKYGKGRLKSYDEQQGHITVEFSNKRTVLFQYPESVLKGFLTVPESRMHVVLRDAKHPKKV